jgi:hypothetical protein
LFILAIIKKTEKNGKDYGQFQNGVGVGGRIGIGTHTHPHNGTKSIHNVFGLEHLANKAFRRITRNE